MICFGLINKNLEEKSEDVKHFCWRMCDEFEEFKFTDIETNGTQNTIVNSILTDFYFHLYGFVLVLGFEFECIILMDFYDECLRDIS